MRFYTADECRDWLSGRAQELPSHENSAETLTLWYPPNPANIDFLWMIQEIYYREPVLLWITEWGIWPSSENLHLYYRLRESYGDKRLLYEAPGHLFQSFEMDDLATFLQVAATNGWGGYVLPVSQHEFSFFFSHDEYIDIFAHAPRVIETLKKRFEYMLSPPSEFHSSNGRQRISAAGESLSPAQVRGMDTETS